MVPRKAALYARLDRLNNYLYIKADPSEMPSEAAPFDVNRPRDAQTTDWPTYHSRLVRFHSRFRTATVQMLNDLEFAFRYLFQVPSRATDAESQTTEISRILADPLKDPIRALVKWVDAVSAAASAARTASGVDEPLSAAPANMQVWRLLDSVRPLGISTDDEELVRPAVTRAAQIRYTKVDAVRYVLAAVSDLSNKKPMDLVRVSPNDTNNLYLVTSEECTDVTPAVRKLAGEGLGHLQGFLEERWRRNDYIWGRLDACEILLRTMRLYSEREGRPWKERDYEDALYLAQQAILKQEAELYAERLKQLGRRARRKWSFTDAQKAADELDRLKPGHLPEPLMRVGSIHRSRPLEAEGEAQP